MLSGCKSGNFYYFPIYLAHWQLKQCISQNFIIFIIKTVVDHALCNCYVLCMVKTQGLLLFLHWFGSLAANARAIIEILINSHQISAVCQTKLIKSNTHIWSMLWHVSHRFYRCLMHHSTQNCYVNTALKYGYSQIHVYRVWYVSSIPYCHIFLY